MTIVMRGSPAGGDSQQDPNAPQQQQQQQQQQQLPAQTGQQPPTTQAPSATTATTTTSTTTTATTSATTQPITTQPQQSQENPPAVIAGQPTSPQGVPTAVEQTVDPAPASVVNPVPMEEGGQGDGVDATVQVSAPNEAFYLKTCRVVEWMPQLRWVNQIKPFV